MPEIQIEQIHPAVTWRIRHEAMYPGQDYELAKLADDDEGIHFALYADHELTSVISLFEKDDLTCQFRKFATVPESQGKGYGTLLLKHMIDYNRAHGIKLLWCNARLSATAFYTKFGFQARGQTFTRHGYDFIIMELPL